MSSPGDSTEAHSPPPPPAGQDIDDDDDFLPADFSSQHNYAQPPTDESRAENNTSMNEVPVPYVVIGVFLMFRPVFRIRIKGLKKI